MDILMKEDDAMESDLLIDGYQLGLLFGLTPSQTRDAISLYEDIRLSDNWNNQRSNKGLMIDCLYLVAKRNKTGITIRKAISITKEYSGVGTQPKPNEWLTTQHSGR